MAESERFGRGGDPPEGVPFGHPDHPMTDSETISEERFQQVRTRVLSQYPSLAEEYLEGEDDG